MMFVGKIKFDINSTSVVKDLGTEASVAEIKRKSQNQSYFLFMQ